MFGVHICMKMFENNVAKGRAELKLDTNNSLTSLCDRNRNFLTERDWFSGYEHFFFIYEIQNMVS